MKRVPTEEEMLEIRDLAKDAAQKARKLYEMGLEMSARWRSTREARLATQQQESDKENVSAK